ncbi:hypothetical protein G647_09216 [Cladophialophora carrionii CBS 160.54]|uniref:C3HC-type domain-containing protein n=1 Tax=Cladophialophora carrionii CBS 160.54 TaxID=1279043 RepID=V9CZE9_9EURO|nr:uncharacterized protein G647_09216 [Cladophialophora carrionii CBS 160.54]ETI19383.1 hypothetical protein G647_09216 [Cladophialophora carrionii CBS 160.54]
MPYAIETKKRKFDRILEALTDSAASPAGSPSRSSLNSHNNTSTTSLTQDTASDSSKRRRITPLSAAANPTTPPSNDLTGHYLPSSRPAFLQRLETFRYVTKWHVPSTDPINAAAWAKRGWTCVDTDTVACGVCKERLYVDLSVDNEMLKAKKQEGEPIGDEEAAENEEEDFAISSDVYDNMVRRYQGMIVTAHAESCLWRKRGCDPSIQRIEGLLNTHSTLSGLRSRYDSLMSHPEEIPLVESLPSTTLVDPDELDQFQSNTGETPDIHALRLAICGWERKTDDVIECRHCFRSLGLWLYRGDAPAIGKLDAVENHLEYCPWRLAEAQDTEIQLPHSSRSIEEVVSQKERVPGWVLVYLAIAKNNRQRRPRPPASGAASEPASSRGSDESMTSQQREKKMKDLLKRIKEIKRPFNVKGLLKRKEKTKM